jgi:hypothetical protein
LRRVGAQPQVNKALNLIGGRVPCVAWNALGRNPRLLEYHNHHVKYDERENNRHCDKIAENESFLESR